MTAGVAIFVKTPGRSPVKTRLAATTGAALAEAWHLESASTVAAVAEAARLEVYWAVAEAACATDPRWSAYRVLVQPDAGLGARMFEIHRELVARHGCGLLLGADTPQLRAIELRRAAAWLDPKRPRLVLGPSTDGGFWLFGANFEIDRTRWTSVAYSRADTARRFRRAMEGLGSWLELEQLTDLDTADDIPHVAAQLARLDAPLDAQMRFLRGLEAAAW